MATPRSAWIVWLATAAACGGPAPPTPASPSGSTVATNRLDVTPPGAPCSAPALGAPDYLVAPANMLDWSATSAHSDLIAGFRTGTGP